MGTRCTASIMAYLHEKVVKASGFEELCQYVGTRYPATIMAYLHEKVVKVSGFLTETVLLSTHNICFG